MIRVPYIDLTKILACPLLLTRTFEVSPTSKKIIMEKCGSTSGLDRVVSWAIFFPDHPTSLLLFYAWSKISLWHSYLDPIIEDSRQPSLGLRFLNRASPHLQVT